MNKIRAVLRQFPGADQVAAILAIGWGLAVLEQVVTQRTERLDSLTLEISAREQQLADLVLNTEPAPAAPTVEFTIDPAAFTEKDYR